MSVFTVEYSTLEYLEFINKDIFSYYRAKYVGNDVSVRKLLNIEKKTLSKYNARGIGLSLLNTMRHPNIIQYVGMCKTNEDEYIVTEFLNGSNLYDKLRDNIKLSWKLRVNLAIQICCAIVYIHTKNTIIRYLTSQNLLINNNWKVKLNNFGYIGIANSKEYMTFFIPEKWMAPEIMLGGKYDVQVDVYSFGMILTEFIRRKDPPPRVPEASYRYDETEFMKTIPTDCPKEFLQCALDCTKFFPEERPHIIDVLTRLQNLEKKLEDESP